MVYLQCCFVLSVLSGCYMACACETAAVSAHSVYTTQPLPANPHTQNACVFSCILTLEWSAICGPYILWRWLASCSSDCLRASCHEMHPAWLPGDQQAVVMVDAMPMPGELWSLGSSQQKLLRDFRRVSVLEERGAERGSVRQSSLKGWERASISHWHWNPFKGDIGKTSERQDGAHVGFSKHTYTILNWTELNHSVICLMLSVRGDKGHSESDSCMSFSVGIHV